MSTALRRDHPAGDRPLARGHALAAALMGAAGTLIGLIWWGYLVAFSLGVTGLVLAAWALRGGAAGRERRLALVGAVLSILALALSVYGFVEFLDRADAGPTPDVLPAMEQPAPEQPAPAPGTP